MCFSSPKTPAAPAPTPIPAAPSTDSKGVEDARDREKRRRALSEGKSSTMVTGALGDTSAAPVAQKTLLGA